ncbi:MAG: tetratricopeptide repeat protein [Methylotenera sp.]|nr:tetratricopeptide repeat protein [Methylotenera sp.]
MKSPENYSKSSLDDKPRNPQSKAIKSGNPSKVSMNALLTMVNKGRFNEADQLATALTKNHPTDGLGWKVLGVIRLQQGLMGEAFEALKIAATFLPNDSEVHYNMGNCYYDQHLFVEAANSYQQALKLDSSFAEAYYNLGSVQKELGLNIESEVSYKTALKLKPKNAEINFNLAQMLYEQARYSEAIDYYQQAIKLKADFVAVHVNLGACYKALGHFHEAITCYKNALKLNPEHTDACNNLGVVLKELGDIEDAENCYRTAIAINSEYVPAYNNLGILLKDMGRTSEAELCYMKALNVDPLRAITHSNLAVLLRELGRYADSEMCCRNALKITPNYVDAYNNLGLALDSQGRFDEAVTAFEQALKFDLNNISVLSNFSVTLNTLGQLTRAEVYLKKALTIAPQFINAHINLCVNYLAQGRVQEAEEICIKTLQIQPDNVDAQSNLLFSMNYSSRYSPVACLDKARAYGATVVDKVEAPFTAWQHNLNPTRLRIGLVSGDLRQHVVAYFLENFLQHVDSSIIELIAYSTTHQEDVVTARLKPHFSGWKSLVGLSDQAAAELIHEDSLHILLDLSGHGSGNRLPIFAWKPAPIQVSWLGYFATTGLAAMDYFIADAVGVPESNQYQFVEKIKYLPDTRLCFTVPDADVAVSELPALTNQFITFGSFQNMAKVSDDVLDLWAEILLAVPNSKLRWQYKSFGDATVVEDLTQRLAKREIESNRFDLLGAVTREAYLAAHQEVDVILDTFPFNGGTTTCEALWMGVPTLTLAGNSLIARQGASLLTAVGLADWVAESKLEFLSKAKSFCSDFGQLAMLRTKLRTQAMASPLFDGQRFAKKMEQVLWDMWSEHQGLDCKPNFKSVESKFIPLSKNDREAMRTLKLSVEIVSATRYSETEFWAKSALGLSLKRHLKQDPRLSAHIAFENTRGLSEVFNERIEKADKDATLVFIHDDVWIDEANFADAIATGLEQFDVIGIAGNKRRIPNQPAWAFVDLNFTWDDKANLSGQVAHSKNAFGAEEIFGEAPAACELLDGVFLAAKKSSLDKAKVRFDEQFDFHFYDMDFCRTARRAGLVLGTWLIKLTHQSSGAFGTQQWREKHQKYLNKWEEPQLNAVMKNNAVEKNDASEVNQALQQVISEVLEMALKHHDAGKIEQAEVLYREILDIQPNHAEANHNLGVIEAHLKGANIALPRLEAAVQAKPENEQFWVSYIDAIMQTSPIDAAIDALELGQKYGLSTEKAQMLAADYMQAYESNLQLSKQTAPKILNLQIQHELKDTF